MTCTCHGPIPNPGCAVDHALIAEHERQQMDDFGDPSKLLHEIARVDEHGKLKPRDVDLLGDLAEFVAWSLDNLHPSAPAQFLRLACHIDRGIRKTVAERNQLGRAA